MYRVALVLMAAVGAIVFGSAPGLLMPPAAASVPLAQSFAKIDPAAASPPVFSLYGGPRSLRLPEPLQPPPPPTPKEALQRGVLIVVSLPSQRAFVFKKGAMWDSTRVSTGKPGNDTPKGVFPILQKKVLNRSTLYDGAPMPFMQRITWDGIALHAGRVPGYPASHGCIRLPEEFARKLYDITNFTSTIVVVTNEPVDSPEKARQRA